MNALIAAFSSGVFEQDLLFRMGQFVHGGFYFKRATIEGG
jgi:hypothetical protein